MKKVIVLLTTLALSVALIGCQQPTEKTENPETPVVNETAKEEATSEEATSEEEVAIKPDIKIKRDILGNVPKLLKKLTLVDDADYDAYIANSVFNQSYMAKDDHVLRTVEVFTLPEATDASALYVYTEDGFVVSAKFDEFNGSFEPTFAYDAFVAFFPEASEFSVALEKVAIDENDLVASGQTLTQEYEGKNAMDLLTALEVMSPELSYEDVATKDAYAVYSVKNPATTDDENLDYQLGVYMDQDGMIKSIDVFKATDSVVVPFL